MLSCVAFSWISPVLTKCITLSLSFNLGNSQMLQGERWGKYGGWGTIEMPLLLRNCRTFSQLHWTGTEVQAYTWGHRTVEEKVQTSTAVHRIYPFYMVNTTSLALYVPRQCIAFTNVLTARCILSCGISRINIIMQLLNYVSSIFFSLNPSIYF